MKTMRPRLAPFGARRRHIFLAEFGKDRGPRQPRNGGERMEGKHDRRQRQMRQRIAKGTRLARYPGINKRKAGDGFDRILKDDIRPARPRRPVQSGIKQQQHQQAKPEDRHGIAEERHETGKPVHPCPLPHGGGYTERKTDDGTKNDRRRRKLDRRRKGAGDVLRHRLAGRDRLAEIA